LREKSHSLPVQCGIGFATAKQFVNEGAYVLSRVVVIPNWPCSKEIGRNVTGVQGDVSNLGDLDRLFAQIERGRESSISYSPMPVRRSMRPRKITEELYDLTFDINAKGLLSRCRRRFAAPGRRSII